MNSVLICLIICHVIELAYFLNRERKQHEYLTNFIDHYKKQLDQEEKGH